MTPRFSRPLLPFVVLALIAGSGCVPNVVWLPDSCGIATTDWPGGLPGESQGRLIQYDLAKKTALASSPNVIHNQFLA